MNALVRFSDAALIGVHALVALARSPGRYVTVRELAAHLRASEHHTAKVLQRLARTGLVRSVKGPSGGFELTRTPREMSFRDAIEAIDGPIADDFCPFRAGHCDPSSCIFGDDVRSHSKSLLRYLERRTIADGAEMIQV